MPASPGPAGAATASPVPAPAGALGISWPPGQALPHFAEPRALDVASVVDAPSDVAIMLATLQGVVNRWQPRIYLLQSAEEGPLTWLTALGVPTTTYAPYDLVGRYRRFVQGLIVYDPAVAETINVATSLAGERGDLAVDGALATRLATLYEMRIDADLRGRFANAIAADTWALANVAPGCSHRMIVGLDPRVDEADLRDYAVANRACVVWLDAGVPSEASLLGRFLAQLPADAPYLGWWPQNDEAPGVGFASRHAVYTIAADLSQNMTVFSGGAAPIASHQAPAPPVPLSNAIYLTFTFSDGDNTQYMQHHLPLIWDDPARGSVPLNWTVNPLLLDLAPAILAHYQRTASPNDLLIAGPSGAGYQYPSYWPASALPVYAQRTAAYMRADGLTALTILNDTPAGTGFAPDPKTLAQYVDAIAPDGIELNAATSLVPRVEGGTAIVNNVFASTTDDIDAAIAQATAGWNGDGPLFLSFYVYGFTLAPSDVASVVAALDGRYHTVRGDQFFALVRDALGNGTMPSRLSRPRW